MTPIDLQHILRKRLPHISRWKQVTCYKWNSKRLPWYIDEPEEGKFYIVWSQPKVGNIHDVEHREIPLSDLGEVVARNKQRLRNRTKNHK